MLICERNADGALLVLFEALASVAVEPSNLAVLVVPVPGELRWPSVERSPRDALDPVIDLLPALAVGRIRGGASSSSAAPLRDQ